MSGSSDFETIAPIADRWSPRAFADRPVEPEKLRSVLAAAGKAPSSANEQPWRFLVATRDDPPAFQRMLGCIREKNRDWAAAAAVLMVVVAKTTYSNSGGHNRHAWHDVGQAVAFLSIQATALGLHLHQMGGIYREEARERYHVPDGYEIVSVVAMGYLGDPQQLPEELQTKERRSRSRKPLNEWVFAASFGEPADLG